jgi:hypothetical protein
VDTGFRKRSCPSNDKGDESDSTQLNQTLAPAPVNERAPV